MGRPVEQDRPGQDGPRPDRPGPDRAGPDRAGPDRPGQDRAGRRAAARAHDREILRLALPALGALVAEPLYLLTDSAVVGRLGTAPLAGLGLAATVLTTVVGLCVFLAYGTTAVVARRLGAGDLPGALRAGVDGMWLAVLVGVLLLVIGVPAAPLLVDALGASAAVRPEALDYLRVSLVGLPAMLLVLAATGVLRGLQDTRTPFVVSGVSAAGNAALSALLVLVVGWGVAGSALATVVAQVGAAAYLAVLAPALRRHGVALRPDTAGVRRAARAGWHLLLRTVTLRAALVLATAVAAGLGDEELAAHHVVFLVWSLLALVLDAIAIAAQALTGRSLGAGEGAQAREVTWRMVRWGVVSGVVLGLLVLTLAPLLPALFSEDPAVRALMTAALVVAALLQPVCGVVFVLDGVLIGAGDNRYLALAGLLPLAVFAVAVGVVSAAGGGLSALWWAIGAFMAARLAVLVHRTRGDRWLVLGRG